ncbi:MAG: hypothetical protein ACXVFT_07975 [Solirubrobacteraceae bacterium]
MARAAIATLLVASTTLAACGTASNAASPPPQTRRTPAVTAPAPGCTDAAAAELVAVSRHIYDQAVSGRNVVAAVARLRRSTALGQAVAAHDPRAVRAALAPLLKHQIIRIDISAGSRTLVRVGSKPAYAPVHGTIASGGRVVGRYVLTVSDDRAFAGLTRSLTGASVRFGHSAGPGAVTLPATAFPSGATTISLALPHLPASLCGPTATDTQMNTIGLVAHNVMAGEAAGAGARFAVRHAEKDAAFRRAVAAGDPAAVRAAIVTFFRDKRFHIVRVRAWRGGRLVNDVGGPFVLSPATGTIRAPGGRVAGRFLLAVQDDTGFIKLVHRFTGADVVLRKGSVPVPGSNISPGPPFAPGLGMTTYHGQTFRSYGFVGTSFPSGPLYVSLLVH